jgi:drug/metabolite transporter (DMT)-like permease
VNQTRHSLDAVAILMLLVLCASWGLQQVSIKIVHHGISPLMQAGLRSTGAAILLVAWMMIRKERIFDRDGTWWWGIAVGVLFAVEFMLIYWGLEFTMASRAVVFLYLTPFFVAIGAQLFLPGERLTVMQAIGLCCAFVGIMVAFSESLGFPTRSMLVGDCMMIGAALFWASTTILIKAGPLARVRPSKTLLYQLAISAVLLPIGSVMIGESGVVGMNSVTIANMLYQAVWVAFITYLGWFWLVRNYPPSRLASFTFCTPLFGVLAGALILREPLTARLLGALVFVGLGIYLVNRPTYRPVMPAGQMAVGDKN